MAGEQTSKPLWYHILYLLMHAGKEIGRRPGLWTRLHSYYGLTDKQPQIMARNARSSYAFELPSRPSRLGPAGEHPGANRSQSGLFPEFFPSFPVLRVGNFASVVFNHPVVDASRH
jgi:hypothetical protein